MVGELIDCDHSNHTFRGSLQARQPAVNRSGVKPVCRFESCPLSLAFFAFHEFVVQRQNGWFLPSDSGGSSPPRLTVL